MTKAVKLLLTLLELPVEVSYYYIRMNFNNLVPIVTTSVAMATVLFPLKVAKTTTRRSRVGYQKALGGAPNGCASLYYNLEMSRRSGRSFSAFLRDSAPS